MDDWEEEVCRYEQLMLEEQLAEEAGFARYYSTPQREWTEVKPKERYL